MLLKVLDAQGQTQNIVVDGQEAVIDRSTNIQAAAAQHVMEANPTRSGFWFKNVGGYDMFVDDLKDAVADASISMKVAPGEIWPPNGYPMSAGILSVIGTIGDLFLAREW